MQELQARAAAGDPEAIAELKKLKKELAEIDSEDVLDSTSARKQQILNECRSLPHVPPPVILRLLPG